MDSNKHNGRIPQLRFPGFEGEWEEKTLADICNITAGGDAPKQNFSKVKTGIYNVPVISNGIGENAIYGYTDIPKITQSAVTVAARGTIGYAEYRDYPYYPIIRLLSVIAKDSTIDTKYLSYLLSVQKYHSTDGGIPQLTVPMIGSTIIPIPSLLEQRTIAECLEAIDQMISAQNQKVESLKTHKKGLMQQLFPQPGATTPALRFPGFEEFWEENKLGDICDSILVGFPFKRQDITDNSSGHPILRAYSIGEGIIRHGKDYDKYYPGDTKPLERYKVSTGDIVISMDGSVGRNIALVSDDENGYLLIQRVARLRVTKYPVQLIYQQIISQRFKDYVAGEKVGAVIAHISQKQIESFPVFIPKSQQEQNKVADTLTETDRLISTQEQKVESLKTHKKGLMQQLFPQPVK